MFAGQWHAIGVVPITATGLAPLRDVIRILGKKFSRYQHEPEFADSRRWRMNRC
jgi:hypothetical protein